MRFAVRADASVTHGTGHVMRCLTLASAMRAVGGDIFFICRELPGNLCDLVEKRGFIVYRLPHENSRGVLPGRGESLPDLGLGVSCARDVQETAAVLATHGPEVDWMIVDGYAFDRAWEKQMRPYVHRIMVVDDMANRPHDCDLLLDQNLHKHYESRYDGIVPAHCRKLLGPRYALLREEFRQCRPLRRALDQPVRRIFLFFSGSDLENETEKALQAIMLLREWNSMEVDVVVGAANMRKDTIRRYCEDSKNMHYYCQIEDIASLMAGADLAVGAAGSTSWERCCLGLPAVVAVLSQDQVSIADALADCGAVVNLGWHAAVTVGDYVQAIEALQGARLREMAVKGMALVDGLGAMRVAESLAA